MFLGVYSPWVLPGTVMYGVIVVKMVPDRTGLILLADLNGDVNQN